MLPWQRTDPDVSSIITEGFVFLSEKNGNCMTLAHLDQTTMETSLADFRTFLYNSKACSLKKANKSKGDWNLGGCYGNAPTQINVHVLLCTSTLLNLVKFCLIFLEISIII